MLADHRLHLARVRREQLEVEPGIALAQPLDQLVGLGGQAARVDAEDLDRRVELVGHVEQRDAVDLERGRERDPRREALERPLEQLLRLLALELDRELARLQLVDQLDRTHAASFSSRVRAGSRPARTPSSSSLSRSQNIAEVLAGAAGGEPARDQPLDGGVELLGRHAAEQRAADRRARAEAAAQEDVVGLPPLARARRAPSCPGSRGRRPSAGRTRAGSRRGGAAARRSRSPKLASRCLTSTSSRVFVSATEKLQCGSPVQAIAVARTRLTSSGKPISPRRGDGLVDLGHRDVRDDEVLLARQADVAAEALRQVGDARSSGRRRRGRGGPARRCTRGPAASAACTPRWSPSVVGRRQLRSRRAAGRAAARRSRGSPPGRSRRP